MDKEEEEEEGEKGEEKGEEERRRGQGKEMEKKDVFRSKFRIISRGFSSLAALVVVDHFHLSRFTTVNCIGGTHTPEV